MTVRPAFTPVPSGGEPISSLKNAASTSWVRKIAETVNNILSGRVNTCLDVMMRAGFATTTIVDARISPFSGLLLMPLTTHAAALLYAAPYVLPDPASRIGGSVIFDHANTANADQNFTLIILG